MYRVKSCSSSPPLGQYLDGINSHERVTAIKVDDDTNCFSTLTNFKLTSAFIPRQSSSTSAIGHNSTVYKKSSLHCFLIKSVIFNYRLNITR